MQRFPVHVVLSAILFTVCLLIVSCGGGDSDNGDDQPAVAEAPAMGAWTFMVYMAADNNISNAAKIDINEMETVGSSSEVNIIVQVEFNKNETPDLPLSTVRGRVVRDQNQSTVPLSTVRGRVVRDQNQSTVGPWYNEIGNKDMTDPETLKEFITWSVQNYPAERYALVLWSHGAGWKAEDVSPILGKGMMTDNTSSGGAHVMSLAEIAEGLKGSGVVFDLINFDACLMGMYEVAYELKDYASFITFSENLYPVNGDAYDAVLRELIAAPSMNGVQLAGTTAVKCREFYASNGTAMTKSVIDTAMMDDLHSLVCNLGDYLSKHLESEKAHVLDASASSLSFETSGHRDLGDFLQKLDARTNDEEVKAIIGKLREKLSQTVITNEVFTSDPADPLSEAQGIAIYLPSPTQASLDDLGLYSSLACNRNPDMTWGDLVYRIVTEKQDNESGRR